MPTEEQKAALTVARGRVAAGIKDPADKKKFIAGSGEVDKHPDAVQSGTELEAAKQSREKNMSAVKDVLGNYHDGGKVKKTGKYQLEEDETVLPKDKKRATKLAKEHLGAGILDGLKEEAEKKDKPKEEKKESKKSEKKEDHKKSKKHHMKHTHIEYHSNGSATMKHSMEDGSEHGSAHADGEDLISSLGSDMNNSTVGAPPAPQQTPEAPGAAVPPAAPQA